jgi:rhodanese-like protein
MARHAPQDHQHTRDEERKIREAALDETIKASFPASDPPSSIPNPDDHDALARQNARARSTARDAAASSVTVDDVKVMLDQGLPITFIDARNPIAWGSSKVKLPGAIRVPLDEVDQLLPQLPRDRHLITYCT